MHTSTDGLLETDAEQNYALEDVHVDGEHITITFSRKYDTCDDHDYLIDVSTLIEI